MERSEKTLTPMKWMLHFALASISLTASLNTPRLHLNKMAVLPWLGLLPLATSSRARAEFSSNTPPKQICKENPVNARWKKIQGLIVFPPPVDLSAFLQWEFAGLSCTLWGCWPPRRRSRRQSGNSEPSKREFNATMGNIYLDRACKPALGSRCACAPQFAMRLRLLWRCKSAGGDLPLAFYRTSASTARPWRLRKKTDGKDERKSKNDKS